MHCTTKKIKFWPSKNGCATILKLSVQILLKNLARKLQLCVWASIGINFEERICGRLSNLRQLGDICQPGKNAVVYQITLVLQRSTRAVVSLMHHHAGLQVDYRIPVAYANAGTYSLVCRMHWSGVANGIDTVLVGSAEIRRKHSFLLPFSLPDHAIPTPVPAP